MKLKNIPVKDIARNPWNPHFATSDELERILHSILDKGMRDPILVVEWDRPAKWSGEEVEPQGKYMLIDGEQRFTAYVRGVSQGKLDEEIPAIVMGKLSEFDELDLAELGEMLNHNRGSGEDLVKTGIIAKALAKKRPLDEVAARIGKDRELLRQALAAVNTKAKMVPVRTGLNKEREDVVAVLRFASEDDYAEFEELLGRATARLEKEGASMPEVRRYRRSFTVTEVLKRYVGV